MRGKSRPLTRRLFFSGVTGESSKRNSVGTTSRFRVESKDGTGDDSRRDESYDSETKSEVKPIDIGRGRKGIVKPKYKKGTIRVKIGKFTNLSTVNSVGRSVPVQHEGPPRDSVFRDRSRTPVVGT